MAMSPPGLLKGRMMVMVIMMVITMMMISPAPPGNSDSSSCGNLNGNIVAVEAVTIIGIDFGLNFMKVSLVEPKRLFDIVLTPDSKRKSYTALGIVGEERYYGTDAFGAYSKTPKSTIWRARELLGRDPGHEGVHNLLRHQYNHTLVPPSDVFEDGTGSLAVVLPSVVNEQGENAPSQFTAEEIVAMLLQNAKDMAKEFSNSKEEVKSSVITVPSFFTPFERQALLDAAKIAGLEVLSLTDEISAAGVKFAFDRSFEKDVQNYVFFNMGAASTQVSIVSYSGTGGPKGKRFMNVLAKSWDAFLGAEEFDFLLMEHLANEFDEKHGKHGKETSIRESPRAMAKLKKECRKIKEVLSANTEIPVTIESLHNDIDFRSHVTRAQLEKMGEPLFARVSAPLKTALERANLTLMDIHGVELLGGGMRIPRVRAELESFFKEGRPDSLPLPLGTHLNADEAMALGSSYQAANLSTAYFKVPRAIVLQDVSSYGVDIVVSSKSEDGEAKPMFPQAQVFPSGTALGKKKKLKRFESTTDLLISLKIKSYDEGAATATTAKSLSSKETDDVSTNTDGGALYATYQVTGVSDAIESLGKHGNPNISVSFHLDHNGLPQLTAATALFQEQYEVTVNVTSEDKAQKEEKGDESSAVDEDSSAGKMEKDHDDDDAVVGEEAEQETSGEASEKASGDTSGEEEQQVGEKEEGAEEETPQYETKTVTKTRTHRHPLTIERTDEGVSIRPLSSDALSKGRATLKKWEDKDRERLALAAARNEFESYIFAARGKIQGLEDRLAEVASQEEYDALMHRFESAEDWLYSDEGSLADVGTLKAEKNKLKESVEKLLLRLTEFHDRAKVTEAARSLLEKFEKQKNEVWSKERPWLGDALKRAEKKVEELRSWLDEQIGLQDKLSPFDDPVLTSKQITRKMEELQTIVETLLKMKKPKDRPNNVEKQEKEESEQPEETVEGDSEEATQEQQAGEDEKRNEEESEEPYGYSGNMGDDEL